MTFNERYKGNLILIKTFNFSIQIIKYTEILEENRRFVIANQLLKSGTSIGANIKEAQNAESKKDFVHKLKIAIKEADETEYWLFLCNEITHFPPTQKLLSDLQEIIKILNKIISSSRKKVVNGKPLFKNTLSNHLIIKFSNFIEL